LRNLTVHPKALLHIINDILDYSKIEAGKLYLENNFFKLSSIIQNINDLFEYQIKEQGLEFILIDKSNILNLPI
jgi:signal transduction histidine kinase